MPRILLLLLAASLAFGQDDERWFLLHTSDFNVAKQTTIAIMKAACEGDVNGDSCSKCPGSDQGPWTIGSLVVGHFSAPQSEAFAGVGGCFYPGNAGPIALLLSKRNGSWTSLETILAFEPGKLYAQEVSLRP